MDTSKEVEIVDFLAEVLFFSEVSQKSLKNFAAKLTIEVFRKGEVIFEKDEIGDSMYVILDGKVKVYERDHTYGILEKGECFGEYALIDSKKRSAAIAALEETQVLKIDRKYFYELLSTDIGFAKGILSVMIKRHRKLDETQEQLMQSRKELQELNDKLNGLIMGATDAIIMFDKSFKIILANPSAHQILENKDALKRNVLFFLDEPSASKIEHLVSHQFLKEGIQKQTFIDDVIKVIGSEGKESNHEGTLSSYDHEGENFYLLILRNIEERLIAENKITALQTQTAYLEEEVKELTRSFGIIANDQSMMQVLKQIEQVAQTKATVLIHGETGTGKELVAWAIHNSSNRANKPMIRVNCGAIPGNLIESELFGHEKGAFTGAVTSRKGRFLLADGGTIFLDEIGELPIELQPKLLRVIQEGEFEPVGSSETIKVEVRIIAATHRDLKKSISKGQFREDLYYRLNVFPINVPSLKERGDDVCLIAQSMIERFSKELNKTHVTLSETDKIYFKNYDWPGNVRELQNLIERAVIISKNGKIDWSEIIPMKNKEEEASKPLDNQKIYTTQEMQELEKENIVKALKITRWKIYGRNGAAALLNIPPTTLASKIKSLKIERPL
ncbi:sigma 54-interacting transcriptional regulator [Zhouia amylolytica]|uniref:sigma 54-interacting transcriptional regulator n=1 Tax=Zhouia amylolytica TaxID=376730 RepID=UPI0020CB6C6B|nr:sigma 54-interacting transcriptional regulator [Zhouia amylolytica]MCQ0112098.1 sigma 54-interacting transcriptional regulator [Zhouia amylolytica]